MVDGQCLQPYSGADGLLTSEYNRVDQGMSAIAIDKIGGMYDVLLPLAVQRKHGFTMENVNASYLPAGTMGINQACRNKEMAREFILFVLGRDVQSKDLSDGLPVKCPGSPGLGGAGKYKRYIHCCQRS